MCIQDIMLENHVTWEHHQFSPTGASTILDLGYDKSRWGVITMSPNTSAVRVCDGRSTLLSNWYARVLSGDFKGHQFSWKEFGSLVHEPMKIYAEAALTVTCYVGYLPYNLETLEKLVKQNP